eukprot:3631920-Pyramimonas_sp.AAC.1
MADMPAHPLLTPCSPPAHPLLTPCSPPRAGGEGVRDHVHGPAGGAAWALFNGANAHLLADAAGPPPQRDHPPRGRQGVRHHLRLVGGGGGWGGPRGGDDAR